MQQKWHNGAGVQANGSIMCRHLWRVNRLFNMHRLDKNNVMPEKEIIAKFLHKQTVIGDRRRRSAC